MDDGIRLTAFVRANKVYFPYQNEIENLSLDSVGSHKNIYFDETPLTDHYSVKYNKEEKSWELITNALDDKQVI